MLRTRLATGFALGAAFAAVLWLDEPLAPWYPFWFLTGVIALGMAAIEVVSLLNATSARPSGNTVLGGVLALVIANWVPHLLEAEAALTRGSTPGSDPLGPVHAMGWPLTTFIAVVMVAFIVQSIQYHQPGGTMAKLSGTILAISYIGLLGSFILQFRWLAGPYHYMVPLTMLVATAKGSDTGAYLCGRIAGRNKLWPRLSPNKTIEGAVGGLVVGTLAALTVVAVARWLFHVHSLTLGFGVGFGVVVGAAAQLGDLMESMIKRDCARKDASATLPGFGGVLDLIDSLLFAGPVGYGFWLWFA